MQRQRKRLKNKLSCSNDQQDSERIKEELDNKMKEFDKIIENKLNGFITRSKAQIIEQNERNSKYFASLEKKKAESKTISRLNVNGTLITNQKSILSEEKQFYEKLYSKKEQINSTIDFFDNSLPKLSENDRNSCEGILTEQECVKAIKEMKNQKSPGSDGITTEFYKLFWNEIKEHFFKINQLFFSKTRTYRTPKTKYYYTLAKTRKRYYTFRKLETY